MGRAAMGKGVKVGKLRVAIGIAVRDAVGRTSVGVDKASETETGGEPVLSEVEVAGEDAMIGVRVTVLPANVEVVIAFTG